MLLNIHNEESLRIRNKKFSSEWPFNRRKERSNKKKGNKIEGFAELVAVTCLHCRNADASYVLLKVSDLLLN
jgi:hypothetical protein